MCLIPLNLTFKMFKMANVCYVYCTTFKKKSKKEENKIHSFKYIVRQDLSIICTCVSTTTIKIYIFHHSKKLTSVPMQSTLSQLQATLELSKTDHSKTSYK